MSLSLDQIKRLNRVIIERQHEIDLLNAFINKEAELSSSCVIVHGFKSVGKTYCVTQFLNTLNANYSLVRCDECVTRKMLLRRCFDKLNNQGDTVELINDSFSSFMSAVETIPSIRDKHEILVLDRFDQCFESTDDLLASFARMRESSSLKNISIVVVMSGHDPKEIVTMSLPHVYFKPYTETQLINILQMDSFVENELENEKEREVFNQYVKLIVDSFFHFTGSDLTILKDILHKLWNRFVEPLRSGKIPSNEFVKLYQENIDLFTNEDILFNSNVIDYKTKQLEDDIVHEGGNVQDLPMNSKFFLIASYLASYGAPKNDLHKYSKVKAVKYKQRFTSSNPRKKTHMTKHDIDARLLSAAFCDLERILAILAVIYRNSAPSLNYSDKDDLLFIDDEIIDNEEKKQMEKSKFTLTKNIDLSNQIATLYSLGFLNKTAASDILGARVRWKCNLDWKTAELLAKSINVPISDYLMDEFH